MEQGKRFKAIEVNLHTERSEKWDEAIPGYSKAGSGIDCTAADGAQWAKQISAPVWARRNSNMRMRQ